MASRKLITNAIAAEKAPETKGRNVQDGKDYNGLKNIYLILYIHRKREREREREKENESMTSLS